MSKRKMVGFVLVFSLFLTTGCWDRTELNDLALELAWGLDKVQNKGVQVSTQVVIPSKVAGGQYSSGGIQGKSYFVVTGTGKDTLDAVEKMQTRLSRQIFRGHRRVILIGESLARQGLNRVLDTYSRDPNIRMRADILVVKGGTAKDFLKEAYPLENIPANGVLNEDKHLGGPADTSLLNFLIAATSEGSSPLMSAIEIGSNVSSKEEEIQEYPANAKGFRMAGTAIFDKDLKLVGFFNMDETKVIQWVAGNLKEQNITAAVPEVEGNVSLTLNKIDSKIQPTIRGHKIKILVTLTGQGIIRENNTNLDLSQSKNLPVVQSALDKQVQTNVLTTITKIQKQYGTDVFGFSDTIYRKYPYRWKSLRKNWDKEFQKAEISVKVNLRIREVGLTGPSLQLKESELKK